MSVETGNETLEFQTEARQILHLLTHSLDSVWVIVLGGVVSIYGGKLTSYRATAEKLLRRINKVLPENRPVADTRSLEIPIID